MRIIKNSHLHELAARHPECLPAVLHWKSLIAEGTFSNLVELRKTFPHADQVKEKAKTSSRY